VARTGLGRAYLGKEMYVEALGEFQKTLTLAGGVATGPDTYLGYTLAVMGRSSEALGKRDLLQERYRQGTASAYDLALLYAGLNDRDRAMEWLENAIMERSGGLLQVRADPMFDPIRSDPGFESLVRRLGLPPT
jgi:tetratricopeptide (TPR) repeat protein